MPYVSTFYNFVAFIYWFLLQTFFKILIYYFVNNELYVTRLRPILLKRIVMGHVLNLICK